GDDGFLDDRPHDRDPEFDAVQYVVARFIEADEFDEQPPGEGDEGQDVPVVDEPLGGGHEGFGHPGELHLEVREDLLELRDDVEHDEAQDTDGNEDDGDGVDHGPGDAPLEALGLFLEVGKTLEDDFQGTAGLTGLDHVDIEAVEALGVLGEG